MFQALLCDDEISITNFLKNSILWESLGIENVYTASDGREALTIFEKTQIDLLITDIRMPRMDGLELLEAVRLKNPETHCILLTAYGEFQYAKAAFRLGVDNYLLKPIHVDELTETIENTVENMYLHRKNQEALFRENILRRWLTGNIGEDELGERISLLGDINIYQRTYCAVCMRKTEYSVSLSAFTEKCIADISHSYDCLHVWDNQGHYVLIVSGKQINRETLAIVFQKIALQLQISDKIYIVIGTVANQSENLPVSYQGAIRLLSSPDNNPSEMIRSVPDNSSITADPDAAFDYTELSPIIQKAIDYIHREYANGVSIKDFCAKHTITTAYLGYLFKKETNTFFNSYLNSYQLDKAIEQLIHTQEKVNIIAEKNGFSSTSYFISSFKKFTGMSPQKYREQNQ